MGMSASQARLIALTARLNDMEYQGQQINQQRTTLSNQVNALYNTLLDMSVPTPPSTSDYTKVVYSGTQDASKFNLGNVVPTGKNAAGKDTYSIDFSYKMAGHAVSKNINSANMTNTSQYLTYKNVNENYLDTTLLKDIKLYTKGTKIETEEDLPEAGEVATADDIMIETTVENVKNLTGLDIFNANGKEITSLDGMEDTATVYVKCNSADIVGDGDATKKSLVNIDGTHYTNVYQCNEGDGKELREYSDKAIESLDLYWVETIGDKTCTATKITTMADLRAKTNDGTDFDHIFKRDYSNEGGQEYQNPNYNQENSTGLSVGEMPVLEFAMARAELGSSYDDYLVALKHSFPDLVENDLDDDGFAAKFMVYIEKSSSGTNVPHFIRKDELPAFNNSDTTSVRSYEYDEDGTYTNVENKKECELEFDVSTGRITKVGVPDNKGQVVWISINSETVTDEAAYKEAFNQYEYKKHLYDKQQQEINAKTSIIQAEDKNLELKLTRLDNERKAVNTEYEAVKKVVQENIEKSYKTFNG